MIKDTVSDYFGRENNVRTSTKIVVDNDRPVGVEIELEKGYKLQDYPFSKWVQCGDGSLKDHGIELKFAKPYAGKDIIRALIEYERALRYAHNNYKLPVISDRCSTHIHVSITDFNVEQVEALLDNFTFLEPLFFKMGNPVYNRLLNNNCLPLTKQTERTINMNFSSLFNNPKYSAINLNRKFGSAEVRVFNASLSFTQILQWINVLLEFFNYTTTHNIVKEKLSVNLREIFPKTYHYVQSFLPVKLNYEYMSQHSKNLEKIQKFMETSEYIYPEMDSYPLTSILLEKGLL